MKTSVLILTILTLTTTSSIYADDPCNNLNSSVSGTLIAKALQGPYGQFACTCNYSASLQHQGAVILLQGNISNCQSSNPRVQCNGAPLTFGGTCNAGAVSLTAVEPNIPMNGYTINGTLVASGANANEAMSINLH